MESVSISYPSNGSNSSIRAFVVPALNLVLVLLVSLFAFSPTMQAQTATAGMTGVVTDASGAVVPSAVVTLTNKTTGYKTSQTTNAEGQYRFANVPPAPGYQVSFTANGFSPLSVKDIYLTVASVRTQNATLNAGTNVEVEVTASNSEVTLNTTDATIGNTFDVTALNSLPVQERSDPTALFTMQPGVTDTGSVTGARTDQNYITLDGLDVNDLATGGADQSNSGISQGFGGTIVGHAPIDSVEEFHATVAGNMAANGEGGGGQFQLVTKSGTNSFHGNVNEYHRDPSLVANTWFGNNATPIIPRAHLIQNQFGGNFGGPLLHNKLFFFFNYDNNKIISSQTTARVVPLDSLRAGNVSYTNASHGISMLTPLQVKNLDPAAIGENTVWLAALNARFPHSNATGGDGVNSGGYNFSAPNNVNETNYVGRGDYNITDKMKLFARFTISRENSVNQLNEFAGDPPTDPFVDRTYAFVIGHNWAIGNTKVNNFFIGETVEKYSFPNTNNPDGSTWFLFADGTGSALSSTLYLNPSSQARRVPIPEIGDDFTWQKGKHTLQMGGTFKDILAHSTVVADYNAVQMGLGGHVLNLCGPAAGACGGTNPSLRPSDISTGSTADYQYDQAFTTLLSRIGEISADFNYNAAGAALPQLTGDQRFYKYYQTQAYISDSWKMLPSLTLSYGVTYQWFSVPYETHGLESTETMSFNSYFGARAKQSAAGQTGATAVPIINYVLGGKANNGPPLYQPEYHDFAPHVGFAWNPSFDKKLVLNGSAGIVYDRTVIYAVQQIQDADSYLFQQTEPIAEGTSGDPYGSVKNDPRLDANNQISHAHFSPPATPTPPYAPFVTGGVPYGLQIGSAFNETIDPALKTPYSISYNAGVQYQLPQDMILKVSFASRLGRRLLAQADANQIIDFTDPASGQTLSQAFAAITTQVRAGGTITAQPWFEHLMTGTGAPTGGNTKFIVNNVGGLVENGDFGDVVQFLSGFVPLNVGSAAQFSENSFHYNGGFSTYNALLATLQKNLSHGVQFDFNYTYAHSIDNISFFANSQGDTGIGGIGLICDVVHPRECRADSDFDIRQYITGDATYQLPFGRHRAIGGDMPFWANEIIGGWDISGLTEWHTGQAWGTISNAFVASYSNNAPALLIGPKSAVATHLTKLPGGGVNSFKDNSVAEAAYGGPIGFTIGPRNSLHGPHYFNADLGLAKTFPIVGDRLNLKFRADAFNAFNHPNFALPQENVFNGFDQQDYQNPTFGQISATTNPEGNLNSGARVLQLALRLEF